LKREGLGSLKVGPHCAEAADAQLTAKYGRLANEKAAFREGLAYEMLRAAGGPTLKTRVALITDVDPANAQLLTRNALLLEDDDDAMRRVAGTTELTLQNFGDVA